MGERSRYARSRLVAFTREESVWQMSEQCAFHRSDFGKFRRGARARHCPPFSLMVRACHLRQFSSLFVRTSAHFAFQWR